jgi:hypothetical protein
MGDVQDGLRHNGLLSSCKAESTGFSYERGNTMTCLLAALSSTDLHCARPVFSSLCKVISSSAHLMHAFIDLVKRRIRGCTHLPVLRKRHAAERGGGGGGGGAAAAAEEEDDDDEEEEEEGVRTANGWSTRWTHIHTEARRSRKLFRLFPRPHTLRADSFSVPLPPRRI